MLARRRPCGMRERRLEWVPCRFRAIVRPRRARGIRSAVHQAEGRSGPRVHVLISIMIVLVLQANQLTTPIFRSTVAIRLFASFFMSLLETSFSRASTTPSLHRMPTAVPPFSTALTAYSTWKLRPSGEKTELVRSYPVPIDVYGQGSSQFIACEVVWAELGRVFHFTMVALYEGKTENARASQWWE